jgi:hypothetical protein
MRVDELIEALTHRPPFEQVAVGNFGDLDSIRPCVGIGSYAPNEETPPHTVVYFNDETEVNLK